MSKVERAVAALLLGVAVAGGVLIPRLLSEPVGPLGAAIGAGPGRIVVEAPGIARAHPSRRPVSERAGAPARAAAAPTMALTTSTQGEPKPRLAPVKRALEPPTAPPIANLPTTPAPPPTVAVATPSTASPAGEPAALTTSPDGDQQNPPTGYGRDLRGFGHGSSVRQAAPHAVGPHHRGVGHLASPPPGAAQAAHAHGPQARAEARGRSGQRGTSPAPAPVAHGHQGTPPSSGDGTDNGQGHGDGAGHAGGAGHGDGHAGGDGNGQ